MRPPNHPDSIFVLITSSYKLILASFEFLKCVFLHHLLLGNVHCVLPSLCLNEMLMHSMAQLFLSMLLVLET